MYTCVYEYYIIHIYIHMYTYICTVYIYTYVLYIYMYCIYIYVLYVYIYIYVLYIFVTLHVEAVKPRQLARPEFNQLKGSVHSISLLCAVRSNGSAKCMTDHFGQTFFNVDWERVPSFCW